MIYLIYGTDTMGAREKALELVDSLRTKKPNATYFKINDETAEVEKIEELLYGQGLFEKKYIVLLDNVFENTDAKEYIFKNAKEFANSENIFIILEGKLDKKIITKISKVAEKVQEFELKYKKKPEERFNVFAITDAFGERNKKRTWTLLQEALFRGVSAEEIHGIIFWQAKNMLLAKSSPQNINAEDLGMKQFVYNKSIQYGKNFTDEELKDKTFILVKIYHNARGGGEELPLALEKFFLNL